MCYHADDTQDVMAKLAAEGVTEVQLHEPALVMWDSSESLCEMYRMAYSSGDVSLS